MINYSQINIILIGLGPHAKRIYMNLFKKYNIKLNVLVDLESKRNEIMEYLRINGFSSTELFLLDDNTKDHLTLPENKANELKELLKKHEIKYAIISTEPKAHFAYTKFFLENSINILLDKPITAPINSNHDINQTQKIKEEYEELCNLYKKNRLKTKCIIQCQRRFHEGFLYVKNLLKTIVKKYNIPITYIDIYHNDGMWVMPNEFLSRENHPYKYGYGKLFHSGYHFIDLLTWLLEVNQLTTSKDINNCEMYVSTYNPSDFLNVMNNDNYKLIFNTEKFNEIFEEEKNNNIYKDYGEIDFHSILNFKQNNKIITNCSLNLMQSGFSKRSWIDLPKDIYKGNGRIRHERLNINVGPLLNIQIHSYQAYEINDSEQFLNNHIGSVEHFDIYIFRNSKIIGGKPFELIDIATLSEKDKEFFHGYNEKARENCFLSFLNNSNCDSDLLNHKNSIEIVQKAYEIMATKSKESNFKFQIY